ncbi:hypothetical protein SAMN05443545_106280 [Aidingimonas halophila]|uniref:Uncharacterized protein n=1 Tax=Aidingimonas halophila TaxID=574349 RepID=A0A1H3DFX0_9GAMM|nr:hypothetical protein SAMN05443545_106280 [Aidingimonas halophila]
MSVSHLFGYFTLIGVVIPCLARFFQAKGMAVPPDGW